jgi:uncharacterized protein YdeI (YjbR/CyaY-like superfamily)
LTDLAPDIDAALRADSRVHETFQALAPSHRRQYIAWIESAKKPETRPRRIAKTIKMLQAGRKPGMM